jgi:hypothetical protein
MNGNLPEADHLRLLLEQVDQRVRYQRDEWDGLDRKATTVLATTGVLFGLVVNNAEGLGDTPAPGPWCFLGALAMLVLALAAGVVALWPREFRVVPEPEPFVSAYAGKATDLTLGTLISTKAKYFGENRSPMKAKLWLLRGQVVLVAGAGVLLAVALVVRETNANV